MTLKDNEILENDPSLKDIKDEDTQDDIPEDKKLLIEINQIKFKDF